ncbi:MAG: tRNA 2-thiouridine(34) synthase MnmA [Bacillota bacterium]|nr:tRNA 2-thiouridine(34) synthase MnmA [Bacillota bacterium]
MEKVLVALSGGVDSGVAVHLLQEKGYDVFGYTFLTCGDEKDREVVAGDAGAVADFFGISHEIEDIKEDFSDKILSYFVDEYSRGRTPNPCVYCNRYIKFPKLLQAADKLGIHKVATGHYVRAEDGLLKRAANLQKDQSYVLCQLNYSDIPRFIFPLGGYSKAEIREIANNIGLPVANKGDSQEICFIPNDDYAAVIRQYPDKFQPGDFLDKAGNVLGCHKGLPFYTMGQRRGIGIAFGKPMYVTGLDFRANAVYLGEEQELYSSYFSVTSMNYLAPPMEDEFSASVKIRYLSDAVPCRVQPLADAKAKVVLEKPQKSVTPGQYAVFYWGDVLLGGGVIEK